MVLMIANMKPLMVVADFALIVVLAIFANWIVDGIQYAVCRDACFGEWWKLIGTATWMGFMIYLSPFFGRK